MAEDPDTSWLVDLYDEHGTTLHRLTVMLGAEAESGHIVRAALLHLQRRSNRLVDPVERVEFLQEQVIHLARSARGGGGLSFPDVADTRQQQILEALAGLPIRQGEIIVVSHYLSSFGPELAGLCRMTVRGTNQRLEGALTELRHLVGHPGPPSAPGVLESLSQEITAALRSAARLVVPPGTDTLKEDLATRKQVTGARVTLWAAVPLLILSFVVGTWVALGRTPVPATTDPAVESIGPPETEVASSLPARVRAIPIYYVGRADQRLYLEERDLASTGDIVRSSVEALLNVVPQDPDYQSYWAGGRLISSEVSGDTLTLDLSSDAYSGIETQADADLAAAQMVYTVTDLLGRPDLKVEFRADGEEPPEEFAQNDGVWERSGLDPMPLIWITSPRNQQNLDPGQSVILGTVKPDASLPVITVRDADGDTVASTTAQTAIEPGADGWRVWSVTVTLEPGTYVVEAASELTVGNTREVSVESKTITVT